ncbi:hypothetical protein [Streptomyces glaucus]|uniref:Uncharacterized protein n=1 Tax=Streptomyces glaucus TaxID=284029 RepID=A0ABN3JF21_9ACTN
MRNDDSAPHDELRYGVELSQTLATALDGLPSRTEHLVTGAVARGTRIRRRRRFAAWGAAGTATAALSAAAVLFGLPGGPEPATTVALPEFSAGSTAAPAGKEPVTGAATAALLAELLPGRPAVTDATSRDSGRAGGPVRTYAELTLADGGSVAVWLQGGYAQDGVAAPEAGREGEARSKDRPAGKGDPSAERTDLAEHYSCAAGDRKCRVTRLDDGSVLLSREGPGGAGTTADVLRPDGTRIAVTAVGTGFSAGQLRAVAGSARWQLWVDPAVNREAVQANPAGTGGMSG